MNYNTNKKGALGIIIVVVVALLLFGGIILAMNNKVNEPNVINPGVTPTPSVTGTSSVTISPTVSPTPTTAANMMIVKIALLAQPANDERDAEMTTCDIVRMRDVQVPKTTAVLDASLKALFTDNTPWPPSPEFAPGNFVGAQPNLTFDRVILTSGVAKVYLKGNVALAGVCDDPRLESQVNATAKQFPTVKSVQIYVNNKLWTTPSGRG